MRRLLLIMTFFAAAHACAAADIAITFDDLPVVTAGRDPLARQQRITRDLLAHLTERRLPIVGFVNGDKLFVNGTVVPERVALLDRWMDAGFELGNHTFSHRSLNRIAVEEYEADLVAGEQHLADVIRRHRGKLRYFRHPFLHTGRSAEVRERVTAFLGKRGYTIAPVTIDNAEWIFARAFDVAEERKDPALQRKIVDAYLDYMIAKVDYHHHEAKRLFGREIRHVLLVHANALNAEAFGALADRIVKRGHRFVALSHALEDGAYASKDAYFGAYGISWLDRCALTRGVPKEFFAAEPRTPEWVQTVAGVEE
jgi:peptidoglycan/xylan/chitin deacetylase (PgdA/CDA1 family)